MKLPSKIIATIIFIIFIINVNSKSTISDNESIRNADLLTFWSFLSKFDTSLLDTKPKYHILSREIVEGVKKQAEIKRNNQTIHESYVNTSSPSPPLSPPPPPLSPSPPFESNFQWYHYASETIYNYIKVLMCFIAMVSIGYMISILEKIIEIIKIFIYIFKQIYNFIYYIYYLLKRVYRLFKPIKSFEKIQDKNKKFKKRFQNTFNNFQWNGDMYNILNTQLQNHSTSEKKIEFLTTTLYAANPNILNIINDNHIHKIKRVIKEPLVAFSTFSTFSKFQKVVKKIIGWIHILKNIEVRFYKHLENRIRYNISSIPYKLHDDPNIGIIKSIKGIKDKKNIPLPIIKLTNLLNNKLPTKDELIRYLEYISEQDIANIYNVSKKVIKKLIKKYAIIN